MGPVLLDTGVAIGLLEADDAHHSASVAAVRPFRDSGAEFAVSAVTVAELASHGATAKARRVERIEALLSLFGPGAVIPVDRAVAETAGHLRASRQSLRLPDALVAASAIVRGADVLLTTDRRLAKLDGARYVGTSG